MGRFGGKVTEFAATSEYERSAVPAAIHSESVLPAGGSACMGPPARFGTGPRASRASNTGTIDRQSSICDWDGLFCINLSLKDLKSPTVRSCGFDPRLRYQPAYPALPGVLNAADGRVPAPPPADGRRPFIDPAGECRVACRASTTVTAADGAVDPRLRHRCYPQLKRFSYTSVPYVMGWRWDSSVRRAGLKSENELLF